MDRIIILDTIQGTTHRIALISIHPIRILFNLVLMIDCPMMIEEWVVVVVLMVVMVAMSMFVEVRVECSGIRMKIQKTNSVINCIFLRTDVIGIKILCLTTPLRICTIAQRIHLMGKVAFIKITKARFHLQS